MANIADVKKYLSGMEFPAKRSDLMRYAENKKAPQDVVAMLEMLPRDEAFNSVTEVSETLEDLTLDSNVAVDDEEDGDEEEDEGKEMVAIA